MNDDDRSRDSASSLYAGIVVGGTTHDEEKESDSVIFAVQDEHDVSTIGVGPVRNQILATGSSGRPHSKTDLDHDYVPSVFAVQEGNEEEGDVDDGKFNIILDDIEEQRSRSNTQQQKYRRQSEDPPAPIQDGASLIAAEYSTLDSMASTRSSAKTAKRSGGGSLVTRNKKEENSVQERIGFHRVTPTGKSSSFANFNRDAPGVVDSRSVVSEGGTLVGKKIVAGESKISALTISGKWDDKTVSRENFTKTSQTYEVQFNNKKDSNSGINNKTSKASTLTYSGGEWEDEEHENEDDDKFSEIDSYTTAPVNSIKANRPQEVSKLSDITDSYYQEDGSRTTSRFAATSTINTEKSKQTINTNNNKEMSIILEKTVELTDNKPKTILNRKVIIILVVVIILIGIIIGGICGAGVCSGSSSSNEEKSSTIMGIITTPPSPVPSLSPTSSTINVPNMRTMKPTPLFSTSEPTSQNIATDAPTPLRQRYEQIPNFLINNNISSYESINNQTTPQNEAVRWITFSDPYNLEVPNSANDQGFNRFVQRYVAAVLYFSASENGSFRTRDITFLQNIHECSWNLVEVNFQYFCLSNTRSFGIYCNQNLTITQIALPCSGINHIPPEIGSLSYGLELISLANNDIIGNIPVEFAHLSLLRSLDLSHNMISRVLPTGFGKLTSLEELELQDNILVGSLDELKSLNALKYLVLDDNMFTGSFIDSFFSIDTVSADNNYLSGPLPAIELTSYNIEQLSLRNNSITGSIPPNFEFFTNLIYLDLSLNQLSHSIPDMFHDLVNLQVLSLAQNNFLSGSVPFTKTSLTELYLDGTHRTGSIPIDILNLSNLRILNLAENDLTGSLPPGIVRLSQLEHLYLNDNRFSKQLPSNLARLMFLESLRIEHNSFSGGYSTVCNNGLQGRLDTFIADCRNNDYCWCCTLCCFVSPPEKCSPENIAPSGIFKNNTAVLRL